MQNLPYGFSPNNVMRTREKSVAVDFIMKTFGSFGYRKIEQSDFNFIDNLVINRNIGEETKLFKSLDNDGNVLGLINDYTPSIINSILGSANQVALSRLCYNFVGYNSTGYSDRSRQKDIAGADLLGVPQAEGDGEILMMATELLGRLKCDSYRIVLNHADLLRHLALGYNVTNITDGQLRAVIKGERISDFPTELLDKIFTIGGIKGDISTVEKVSGLVTSKGSVDCLLNLFQLYQLLAEFGIEDRVSFDFGYLSDNSYFNGVVFKVVNTNDSSVPIYGGRTNVIVANNLVTDTSIKCDVKEIIALLKKLTPELFFIEKPDVVLGCSNSVASLSKANDLRNKLISNDVKVYVLYNSSAEQCFEYGKINQVESTIFVDADGNIL